MTNFKFLTSRKDHRLRMLEKTTLRRIYLDKGGKVTGR